MAELATQIEAFRQNIIESGIVLDPEGTHHEFVSGMHGRKLDFDLIPDESELFEEWADVAAETITERYSVEKYGKLVVLSVANGTNRLVSPVAERLGGYATPLLTEKVVTAGSSKTVRLTLESKQAIQDLDPDLVVALEDVGTSGGTSSTAVTSARKADARYVVAMNTWQRRPQLEKLEEIGADYTSIIYEPLPTYSPEDCQNHGFCADGWELIEREK